MATRSRPSNGSSRADHPREDAEDRFLPRRRLPDRRRGSERGTTQERRTGEQRRRDGDRRQEEPGFSREEERRLREIVRRPANRRLMLRGTRVSCPRCQGVMRLKRIADWKGVEPTWELRCSACRRNLFIRPGPQD